ncbi:RNA-binding protein S4 [Gordoniibacillus kamchatkensis]|uniref:RNA-binding protein S4 n=1 Tax=Gordoniibacillus kamchatkensis TaxID=1590651 RepID=A0ABR5AL48_9BACL|nr:YlmH/Sll1252 family protein [Paenibacillus sp. VKM B-2647]KIL41762.1 RNA-binding protein S4 [Paenibacillus sp. VKM B-2647]
MNTEIHKHFHPDEHSFVDKARDWIERAVDQHRLRRTDFLDPRQAFILTTLLNRNPDAQLRLDGGYPGAERRRALIAPDYMRLDDEDMGIRVLAVTSGDAKIAELDHSDYMGALLALGMKRDKIGDIHAGPTGCHYLVEEEAADYLHLNLTHVGKVAVHTEVLPPDRLIATESKLQELQLSVASMRLDGIVSDVFRLSRAKAIVPIQAGRCRVNWKPEANPSAQLKAGDIVSMQGFGRFKVLDVEGVTKSGRMRVKVGKYV